MTQQPRPSAAELAVLAWRKSTFSGDNGGQCVEAAPLPDGHVAIRNSNHPRAGTVLVTRAELRAFLRGAKAGEFDDLTRE